MISLFIYVSFSLSLSLFVYGVMPNQVTEQLERAQKLLKQALKRDYYKILGVPRNANKQEITKVQRDVHYYMHHLALTVSSEFIDILFFALCLFLLPCPRVGVPCSRSLVAS